MFGKNPFNEYRATQQQVQEKKAIDAESIDGSTVTDVDASIQEAKFVIPEEIPANERTAFHGAAAAAAKAGKKSFSFGGKTHPVTMKKDTANAIADEKENGPLIVKGKHRAVSPFRKRPKMNTYQAEGIKEDTKLDELSPSTLQSYSKKAKQQAIGLSQKGSKKDLKKFGNRIKGISQADDKMKEGMYKDIDTEKSEPSPRSDAKVKSDFKKRRKTGEKSDVDMNPKLDKGTKDNSMEQKESTIREKLMSVLSEKEDRAKHYKGATKPETMDDKLKGKGAKDMMEPAKNPDVDDTEEKGHIDAVKAGKNAPTAKARSGGDNISKGDKKVVQGGTPLDKIMSAYKTMK